MRKILCAIVLGSAVWCQGALFNNHHRLRQLFDRYDVEKGLLEAQSAGALLSMDSKEEKYEHNSLVTARAYGRQKRYNETIIDGYQQALHSYTPLPKVVSSIIADYAQPGWLLNKIAKVHDGMVSRIGFMHNTTASYSADEKSEEKQGKLWDMHTGRILQTGIHQSSFAIEVPEYHVTRLRAISLLDYDVCGDKLVAVDAHQGLLTWSHPLDLAAAERQGLVQRVVHKKSLLRHQMPFNAFCSVIFSPCGKYIIAGCLDGMVIFFDTVKHAELYTLAHPEGVTALQMVNDDKTGTSTLLAGLRSGDVAIWQRDYEVPLARGTEKLMEEKKVSAHAPSDHKQSLPIEPDHPEPMFMTEDVPPISATEVFKSQCQTCGMICRDCTDLWKADCGITCLMAYQCLENCALCFSNLPGCCVECCICRVR